MNLLHYRKYYLVLFFLVCGLNISAQDANFNHWSAEFTTGIHVPLSKSVGPSRSEYIAFKQFQLSGRYMFTEKFGIKGHYAFNRFANPDDTQMGITMNRAGLEGVANIGKLLKVNYRLRERFGLLFHIGLGITIANPSDANEIDRIGNILAGFTGEIKLNERFTLLGDVTYIANFDQQYGFNGALLNLSKNPETASFVNVSIGIMYNLGEEKYHADWY